MLGWGQLQKLQFLSPKNRFVPAVDVQLAIDVLSMCANSADGDCEFPGNFGA